MKGSFPYVPSTATFVFLKQIQPKGLEIFDFVNTVSKDGTYNMLGNSSGADAARIPPA
jgi:hypothetical protein